MSRYTAGSEEGWDRAYKLILEARRVIATVPHEEDVTKAQFQLGRLQNLIRPHASKEAVRHP